MLKQITVSALILLYSLSVIGMPLHFHYCMGNLQHVSLLVKKGCHESDGAVRHHGCCDQKPVCHQSEPGEVMGMDNCCDDATEWLHEELSAVCAWTQTNTLLQTTLPVVISHVLLISEEQTTPASENRQDLPPPGAPLYKLHCALIFYS